MCCIRHHLLFKSLSMGCRLNHMMQDTSVLRGAPFKLFITVTPLCYESIINMQVAPSYPGAVGESQCVYKSSPSRERKNSTSWG